MKQLISESEKQETRQGQHYHFPVNHKFLDPRTKFCLLILTAVFCLGGVGGGRLAFFRLAISFLPYVLSISNGKRRAAFIRLALLVGSYIYLNGLNEMIAEQGGLLRAVSFLLLFTATIFSRLLPSLEMGDYTMQSTSVSEFTAAMHRLHMPDEIIIPMSVMFRFFPTIQENAKAINESMAMRDIHPYSVSRSMEYRLVPLVECTASIGEDLSASALMRGLGAPVKRTNICRIGFHSGDCCVLLITASVFIISLLVSA